MWLLDSAARTLAEYVANAKRTGGGPFTASLKRYTAQGFTSREAAHFAKQDLQE